MKRGAFGDLLQMLIGFFFDYALQLEAGWQWARNR